MRIFLNENKLNDIKELFKDPAIENTQKIWGKEDSYQKSAIDLRVFNTSFGSISLLYGPRQLGKTTSLKLYLCQLQDSETLIFTDCSTILQKEDLKHHLARLIEGTTTIILDEVQSVEGWHLALRSLYAEGYLRSCRVWCTGSEARYLIESGERLPGRKGEGRVVFARPWSFREYMDFFYPEMCQPFSSLSFKDITPHWLESQSAEWDPMWQAYLTTGGIPKVIGEFKTTHLIDDLTYRMYEDWMMGNWSIVRTAERSLAQLSRRICETLNSRVSYEALKKGTDILSANTIKHLMDIQEDHFSIRSICRFDPQKHQFLPSKMKKIYPIDPFIAKVWAALGWHIKRQYSSSLPSLSLDECAFLTQTFRYEALVDVSYLYSETSKAEVDFYFDGFGFELKSNGKPTPKQRQLLNQCDHAFVVNHDKLPLMAYLVGEKREKTGHSS